MYRRDNLRSVFHFTNSPFKVLLRLPVERIANPKNSTMFASLRKRSRTILPVLFVVNPRDAKCGARPPRVQPFNDCR
jgi:hypothetical protein